MNISDSDLRRFTGLLGAFPVTVYMLDSDHLDQPLLVSENVKVLGYEPKEITGTKNFWVKHIHPDDRERFCSKFRDGLRTGRYTFTYRIRKKDGIYCWILDKGGVLKDSSGKLIKIIGSWMDVSDLIAIEEKLTKKGKDLERIVKEKSKIVQEMEIALKVLLSKVNSLKEEAAETILVNFKRMVVPYFKEIEKLGNGSNGYLKVIEKNLENIASPFIHDLKSKYVNLTPKEIEIACRIRDGKSSKEISEELHNSVRTINFYRDNIRKKLGLKNRKANLASYLNSLS